MTEQILLSVGTRGGGGGAGCLLLVLLLMLWVWVLLDLLQNNFKDSIEKLIWTLVFLFVPGFGMLLYLAMGRSHQVRIAPDEKEIYYKHLP